MTVFWSGGLEKKQKHGNLLSYKTRAWMAYLGHELKECLKGYNSVNILVTAYGSVNHFHFPLLLPDSTVKLLYHFTLHFSLLCYVSSLLFRYRSSLYLDTATTDRGTRKQQRRTSFYKQFDESKTSSFQAGNSLPYGSTIYLEFSF